MSACFVSTMCSCLLLKTGSTKSAVLLIAPATLCANMGLGDTVGNIQISARVLNFGPSSVRKSKSLSSSRRLQQPTEPAEEPWPSKSYSKWESSTGTAHAAFCLRQINKTVSGIKSFITQESKEKILRQIIACIAIIP